jgi:hypothetical protein
MDRVVLEGFWQVLGWCEQFGCRQNAVSCELYIFRFEDVFRNYITSLVGRLVVESSVFKASQERLLKALKDKSHPYSDYLEGKVSIDQNYLLDLWQF